MTLFNKDVCIYMHTDSDLSYMTISLLLDVSSTIASANVHTSPLSVCLKKIST